MCGVYVYTWGNPFLSSVSPIPTKVNAVLKVVVRTAVPLGKTEGVPQAEKVFARAVSSLSTHPCVNRVW